VDKTTKPNTRGPRPRTSGTSVRAADATIRAERFLDAMTDALVRLRLRQIAAEKGLALFTGQSGHAPAPEGSKGESDAE
jgi:hypothetical protein